MAITFSAGAPVSIAAITFLLLGLAPVCYCCEDGDLRLVDGFDNSSGRVEFCHEGEWGTVCDNGWGEDDARVVCRQLGLPTDGVFALPAFGGGGGRILLDNVGCSGGEERLENCTNGGIGNNDCLHLEDAGVICSNDNGSQCVFDDSETQGNSMQCGSGGSQPNTTRTCLQRHGNCVPYRPQERESLCDRFYTPGVDFVYVPYDRIGDFYLILDSLIESMVLTQSIFEDCNGPIMEVFCHFLFPPCGNVSVFEPPTSVCEDVCHYMDGVCSEQLQQLLETLEQMRGVIIGNTIVPPEEAGLTPINCSNTGEYLEPLPHCCSNAGVEIPSCINVDDLGTPSEDLSCLESDSNSSNLAPIIAGPIAAVILLMFMIGLFVAMILAKRYYQRKTKRVEKQHNSNADLSKNTATPLPRIRVSYIRDISQQNLIVPGKQITLLGCVGQGEFGIVHRANLSSLSGQDLVAVKSLRGVYGASDLNSLIEESLKMSNFHHPNVMKLIGVCIDMGASPYIVMPYMTNGSLQSYLRNHRAELTIDSDGSTDGSDGSTELVNSTQQQLLSMCLQIAKGMEYLASQKFVHRDLAARNCMIDKDFVIKVADFGLSEDIYARNYFRQGRQGEDGEAPVKLPVKWMAVESLNDGVFTEKTDVWSYGVTCWEVFSLGKTPYPGVDPFSLIRCLEGGKRLKKPFNAACSHDVYDVMKRCWQEEPEQRPTFSELVVIISTSLEGMSVYLDLTIQPLAPSQSEFRVAEANDTHAEHENECSDPQAPVLCQDNASTSEHKQLTEFESDYLDFTT